MCSLLHCDRLSLFAASSCRHLEGSHSLQDKVHGLELDELGSDVSIKVPVPQGGKTGTMVGNAFGC